MLNELTHSLSSKAWPDLVWMWKINFYFSARCLWLKSTSTACLEPKSIYKTIGKQSEIYIERIYTGSSCASPCAKQKVLSVSAWLFPSPSLGLGGQSHHPCGHALPGSGVQYTSSTVDGITQLPQWYHLCTESTKMIQMNLFTKQKDSQTENTGSIPDLGKSHILRSN